MTVTTIIAILLAVLLGMAIMVSVNLYYRADNLLRSNKSLHGQLKPAKQPTLFSGSDDDNKPAVPNDLYQH